MLCSKYNLQSELTFETPCILCLLFTGNVPIGRIYISMRADYKQMLRYAYNLLILKLDHETP